MKNYVKNENELTVTITLTEEEFENHFCRCADCGELLFISEAIRIDGDWFCLGCVETCDVCGEYIRSSESYKALDSDYLYCKNCYYSETYECQDCHNRFRYEDSLREDDIGHFYCDDCWEEHKPLIMPYHSMKDGGNIVFYGDADRHNELYIGVEIETDCEHRVEREKIARGVKDILGDFVNIESDGSLMNGFEIIGNPGTLNYHLALMPKYKKAFKYLMDNDMKGHDISTSGMHMHIDRRFFGDKEDSSIAKMLYIFEKFRPELMTFSRRTESQVADWCRSRKQNYSGQAGWIKRAVEESKGFNEYSNRYYSLNLTNLHTLEIRLWRSSLNDQTFEATLRFTERLAKLCKNTKATDLAKMSFESILGDNDVVVNYWNRINNK